MNNILAVITPSLKTPSFRYRIKQYVPFLSNSGWTVEIRELPRISVDDVNNMKFWLDKASLLFLQKKLLNKKETRLLDTWKSKIIFDFDDAVYLPAFNLAPGISGFCKRRHCRKKFLQTVNLANSIICANKVLAAQISQLEKTCHILPTPVPVDRYIQADFSKNGPFVMGWIGTDSNQRYLDLLEEPLRRLNSEKDIMLKIISGKPYPFKACPVEFKKWALQDEAADLASLDVGVMPLTDDSWTRGKAAFKALQYMSAGLPSVLSPVGMNKSVIKHGTNGFLAETDKEWFENLLMLAEDIDLRKKVGNAAREFVQEKYSLAVTAPKLLEILQSCLEKSG